MIKNAHEYRVSNAKKRKLEQFLEQFKVNAQKELRKDPRWYKLQEDAIESLIADLNTELAEYNKLTSGKLKAPDLDIVEALPSKLVKARLALNWTQKDLADRLQMKQQQIQRYESTDYQTASLGTVSMIAKVLVAAARSTGKSV